MAEMLVPSQGTPRTRCFEHEVERDSVSGRIGGLWSGGRAVF